MNTGFEELKTDPALLERLRTARPPTALEIQEQRVSFAYGSLGHANTLTKDQVRAILAQQAGGCNRQIKDLSIGTPSQQAGP